MVKLVDYKITDNNKKFISNLIEKDENLKNLNLNIDNIIENFKNIKIKPVFGNGYNTELQNIETANENIENLGLLGSLCFKDYDNIINNNYYLSQNTIELLKPKNENINIELVKFNEQSKEKNHFVVKYLNNNENFYINSKKDGNEQNTIYTDTQINGCCGIHALENAFILEDINKNLGEYATTANVKNSFSLIKQMDKPEITSEENLFSLIKQMGKPEITSEKNLLEQRKILLKIELVEYSELKNKEEIKDKLKEEFKNNCKFYKEVNNEIYGQYTLKNIVNKIKVTSDFKNKTKHQDSIKTIISADSKKENSVAATPDNTQNIINNKTIETTPIENKEEAKEIILNAKKLNPNVDETIIPQIVDKENYKLIEEEAKKQGQQIPNFDVVTKNGIAPQVALIPLNQVGFILAGLIPGGALIGAVVLYANLKLFPKDSKKIMETEVADNEIEDDFKIYKKEEINEALNNKKEQNLGIKENNSETFISGKPLDIDKETMLTGQHNERPENTSEKKTENISFKELNLFSEITDVGSINDKNISSKEIKSSKSVAIGSKSI